MKFDIKVEAVFNFTDLNLVLFNERLVDASYLASSLRDDCVKVTPELWKKLNEEDQFKLIQSYVDNALTAASSGCLISSHVSLYEEK